MVGEENSDSVCMCGYRHKHMEGALLDSERLKILGTSPLPPGTLAGARLIAA